MQRATRSALLHATRIVACCTLYAARAVSRVLRGACGKLQHAATVTQRRNASCCVLQSVRLLSHKSRTAPLSESPQSATALCVVCLQLWCWAPTPASCSRRMSRRRRRQTRLQRRRQPIRRRPTSPVRTTTVLRVTSRVRVHAVTACAAPCARLLVCFGPQPARDHLEYSTTRTQERLTAHARMRVFVSACAEGSVRACPYAYARVRDAHTFMRARAHIHACVYHLRVFVRAHLFA
jgi:hypothetical protein